MAKRDHMGKSWGVGGVQGGIKDGKDSIIAMPAKGREQGLRI